MNATDIQAVRDTLKKFQDGYDRRDPALLNDFRTLFLGEDEMEVIGTGGIEPGGDEWCLGPDAACELVRNDWEGWGDLRLDVADARIHTLGDVAWLATTGTVSMDLDPDEVISDSLDYLRGVGEDDTLSARQRMLEIIRSATNTLFEADKGKQYIWPIRFTAVLVRQANQWLFHQIQFSFATTRFPDVRNA